MFFGGKFYFWKIFFFQKIFEISNTQVASFEELESGGGGVAEGGQTPDPQKTLKRMVLGQKIM